MNWIKSSQSFMWVWRQFLTFQKLSLIMEAETAPKCWKLIPFCRRYGRCSKKLIYIIHKFAECIHYGILVGSMLFMPKIILFVWAQYEMCKLKAVDNLWLTSRSTGQHFLSVKPELCPCVSPATPHARDNEFAHPCCIQSCNEAVNSILSDSSLQSTPVIKNETPVLTWTYWHNQFHVTSHIYIYITKHPHFSEELMLVKHLSMQPLFCKTLWYDWIFSTRLVNVLNK